VTTGSDSGIVSWEKSATTPDVTDGIANVLQAVLSNANVSTDDIAYVSIGTTVSGFL